jgi:hypothetical protein
MDYTFQSREASIQNIYEYLFNVAYDLKSQGLKKSDVTPELIKQIVEEFNLNLSSTLEFKFQYFIMYYLNDCLNNCTISTKTKPIAPIVTEPVTAPEVEIQSEEVQSIENEDDLVKILPDKQYDENLMKDLGITEHD